MTGRMLDTRRLTNIFLALVSVVGAFLLGEVSLRTLDGYDLGSVKLMLSDPLPKTADPKKGVVDYARRLTARSDIDLRWFLESPRLAAPPVPEERFTPFVAAGQEAWRARTSSFHRWAIDSRILQQESMARVWNQNFVHDALCGGSELFDGFSFGILTFAGESEKRRPVYRYIPESQIGLNRINKAGFRGEEIQPRKPANTIRVAFLGASTTAGQPEHFFSYPEFVGHWLNNWAQAKGLAVRFEAINAGRPGLTSVDIAEVALTELAPLQPDLVVYYEGSNQLDFRSLLRPPANLERLSGARFSTALATAATYSAIVRRVQYLVRANAPGAGLEPAKPSYELVLPDETSLVEDDRMLPINLPVIFDSLDRIKAWADASGVQMGLASFVWLAHEALRLDPVRHAGIDYYLNDRLWPMRYSDVRKVADFQNRAFDKYAQSRNIPFLDLAPSFPQDPDLFADAIHTTQDGSRLWAWLVFQSILPILEEAIQRGGLPKADDGHEPNFAAEKIEIVPASCRLRESTREAAIRLIATDFAPASQNAQVSAAAPGQQEVRIRTPSGRHDYAASLRLPDLDGIGKPVWIRIKARMKSGRVTFGVLDRQQTAWIVTNRFSRSSDVSFLKLEEPLRAGFLMVANDAETDGEPSEVLIEDIAVLVPATGD